MGFKSVPAQSTAALAEFHLVRVVHARLNDFGTVSGVKSDICRLSRTFDGVPRVF